MKLTIEFVPQTSFYRNVRSEVDRETWDKIRRKAYREANYKCQICGGKGKQHPVECHEIWDYQKGTQKLIGFTALCPKCHQVKHFGLSQIRGLEEDCVKQIMEVNKISRKKADGYIAECWDIWADRSQQEWKLDITYLEKGGE